jgi:predicted AAA+ superfamily ATPase
MMMGMNRPINDAKSASIPRTAKPYAQRTLEHCITESSRNFPALLLTGPRQAGKTTLLRRLAEEGRTYVTLDDPLMMCNAIAEPALFLQRYPPPVLIDEIQRAPQLLHYLKVAADNGAQPGSFWLIAPKHYQSMHNIPESLAGRVVILDLLGISRRELTGSGIDLPPFLPEEGRLKERLKTSPPFPLRELYRCIWRGAFPGLALQEGADRNEFLGAYVRTYLERDIRDLAQVEDEAAFVRFLRACAARTGQLLNIAAIAGEAGISPITGAKWISMLEASGIVYRLGAWSSHLRKNLIRSPKLHFLDTGLACYLAGWSTPEAAEAGVMSEALLETWVVGEILRSWWHNGLCPQFYHFRDKEKRKIDLVIVFNGKAHPIDIRKTASPAPHDVRHFRAMEGFGLELGEGGIVCLADHWLPLKHGVWTVPIGML